MTTRQAEAGDGDNQLFTAKVSPVCCCPRLHSSTNLLDLSAAKVPNHKLEPPVQLQNHDQNTDLR